jgi:hypothetical protein
MSKQKPNFSLRKFSLKPNARGYYNTVYVVQPAKRVAGWPDDMQPNFDLVELPQFEGTRSVMVAIKRAQATIAAASADRFSDYEITVEVWK